MLHRLPVIWLFLFIFIFWSHVSLCDFTPCCPVSTPLCPPVPRLTCVLLSPPLFPISTCLCASLPCSPMSDSAFPPCFPMCLRSCLWSGVLQHSSARFSLILISRIILGHFRPESDGKSKNDKQKKVEKIKHSKISLNRRKFTHGSHPFFF